MQNQLRQLIDDLETGDEAARRYALEDIGDLGDPRGIGPLTDVLCDPSPAIREASVVALSALGEIEGKTVALAMLPALKSENVPLRNAACEVLINIGEHSVTELTKLLSDEDKDVRKFVVDVLALIASPSAGEALTLALRDMNINVAAAAAEALGQIKCGAAVEALAGSLQANGWVRCSVARSLGQIGGCEALQQLHLLAGDEDEMVAFTAILALGDAGGLDSLEYLLCLPGHSNQMIVNASFTALERIFDRLDPSEWWGIRGQIPLEPLISLVSDPNRALRLSAISLLAKVGDASALAPVVEALIADNNREDEELRELAIKAIVSIAPEDISAIVSLLEQASTSVEGRCELVDVLGRVGRPEAFTAVARLIEDPEVILRRVAARAVGSLGGERAAVCLCKALADSDEQVRACAARSLGEILASDAVSSLIPLLEESSTEVREAVAWAIGTVGGDEANDSVSRMVPMLHDEHSGVREAAAGALASIASVETIAAIEALANSELETSRLLAVTALGGVDFQDYMGRILIRSISDPSPLVSAQAFRTLARHPDIEVSSEILEGLRHDSAHVRIAALHFLRLQKPGEWGAVIGDLFAHDPDEQVRHHCARTLGHLGLPEAADLMIDFLSSFVANNAGSPFVALGAIDALVLLNDPRTEGVLDELTGSDNKAICAASMAALEGILKNAGDIEEPKT